MSALRLGPDGRYRVTNSATFGICERKTCDCFDASVSLPAAHQCKLCNELRAFGRCNRRKYKDQIAITVKAVSTPLAFVGTAAVASAESPNHCWSVGTNLCATSSLFIYIGVGISDT